MNVNIQRVILSTFLWSNDLGIDTSDAFILDLSLFKGDRKLIASKVNEITNTEDRFYGILNMELEGTSQYEWLEISKQTPMSFLSAKEYHKKLITILENNILMGVA